MVPVSNPYAPPDPNRPRPPAPPVPQPPVLPAARPSPPPPDPAGALRARRLVNITFLLVLASLVVRLLSAPWSATSVVFALVALVVAVRAVLVGRRARADGTTLVVASVLVFAAGSGLLVGAASLVMLPAQMDYERCRAGAVTQSADKACTQTYDDAVSRLQDRLTGLSLRR